MGKYILKRLLHSGFSMLVILTIVFLLLRAMPVEGYFSEFDKVSEEQIEVTLTRLGLKSPAPVQIADYIQGLLRGDLGLSVRYRKGYPVAKLIAAKVPVSVSIGLVSLAVSLTAGFGLGLVLSDADRLHRPVKAVPGALLIVLIMAVPSAVSHLVIQYYGAGLLGLPMLFDRHAPASWILPVLSLSLGNTAFYAMWLRRFMADERGKDYVRTAVAKGVPAGRAAHVHMLRNAVIPLAQYLPQSVLITVMGSLYVESLYSIPGMGGLLVQAIRLQDNPLVQALVVIYTLLSLAGMLLGDLVLFALDPKAGRKAYTTHSGGHRS